ncbi:SDR family NAD(P)-dependent oxidoreductase [Gordonia humi]|uniref:NAD(P)-dependent dehydrogenase (Short-subunit alcohol dehydrogenase family) n=1 Tax=Gordonia humi TaxID=686429 RepID=A0A840EQE4_9ACTN|nr:SDR family oxidoreductase [Gordonia humi]MBB4133721.1 NAD(P)-dependent dehydrogenase (short-subunit alcohol dehydrogenase family) [Gordonia humi]
MNLGLDGARVLITGGASNIGRGIVHAFAREGARIALSDIDEKQARRVEREARDLGAAEVLVVAGDLTEPGMGATAVDAAAKAFGGVDALVNNAGWSLGEFLARDDDRARWQKLVDINLFATIETTRAAIAAMRAAESGGGSIVTVASEAAFGQIRQGVYGATKAAQVALARTAAREHGRHGIRSNVVCPGLVIPEGPEAVGDDSLWSGGADSVFNENQIDYLLKDTPLGRLTLAEDVADAVVWLSSDVAARQITGQLISVSGGYTMP